MTILRYSNRENDYFTNQLMNQLFKETRGNLLNTRERDTSVDSRTNVVDDEKAFILEVAIPGLSKEDVHVKVEDGILHISAEKKEEEEKNYLRRNFSSFKLDKSYKLSNEIKVEAISAEVKNGILLVILPKIEKEEPKVHQVEIQ